MAKRYTPKKGDIVHLDFAPQSGHEQAGRRPALIISVDQYNARSNLAVVCPITTSTKLWSFKSELPDGLATNGFVLCDHIKSLDLQSRNVQFEERAPQDVIEDADALIQALLGLNS